MSTSAKAKIIFGFIVFIFAIIFIGSTTAQIDEGERGLVLRLGKVDRVLDPGFHFKSPFVEDLVKFQVRTKKLEREATAASADLQYVTTTVAVNYNLEPSKIGDIYGQVGKKHESEWIDPAVQDSVKAATAQFTAEELITKRGEIKAKAYDDLKARMQPYGVIVTELNITDFKFSEQFDIAIEAKVTAEQEALKAQNDLQRVQFEAQQRIEQAKAEAEAIRIQAQAVTQQGGKDYVQLKAIEKWNGSLPQQFVPGSAVPFLNLRWNE